MGKTLFDQLSQLKSKFRRFWQIRKKVKALENYAIAPNFTHHAYIPLVKDCLEQGFVEEEESVFIDHILNKYGLNYLDWAYKTPWVKRQIESLSTKRRQNAPKSPQLQFDFVKATSIPVHVPTHLLGQKNGQISKRAR